MNKDDHGMLGFTLGAIVMAILGASFWSTSVEYTKGKETFKLIEECQKELPRNVSCKLVAVVDNDKFPKGTVEKEGE